MHQLVLQLLEERRLLIAQFRLDPVFRVEKDFSVGLPDPESFHPLPLLPPRVEIRLGKDVDLEVQQAPLNEQLRGCGGLLQTRGQHAGAHLYVDQEVAVQAVDVRPVLMVGLVRMGDQPADQSLALLLAKAVLDRLDDLQPLREVVFGLDRLLDAVGFSAAGVGLGPLDGTGGVDAETAQRCHAVCQPDQVQGLSEFLLDHIDRGDGACIDPAKGAGEFLDVVRVPCGQLCQLRQVRGRRLSGVQNVACEFEGGHLGLRQGAFPEEEPMNGQPLVDAQLGARVDGEILGMHPPHVGRMASIHPPREFVDPHVQLADHQGHLVQQPQRFEDGGEARFVERELIAAVGCAVD